MYCCGNVSRVADCALLLQVRATASARQRLKQRGAQAARWLAAVLRSLLAEHSSVAHVQVELNYANLDSEALATVVPAGLARRLRKCSPSDFYPLFTLYWMSAPTFGTGLN